MAINPSTNYDLAISVMKSNHQRGGLTWGINGFAKVVGFLGK